MVHIIGPVHSFHLPHSNFFKNYLFTINSYLLIDLKKKQTKTNSYTTVWYWANQLNDVSALE